MFFQWKYLLLLLLTIHLNPIFCEEPAKQPQKDKVSDEDDDEDEEPAKPREKIHFVPPKIGDNLHFALYFKSPSDLASDLTVSLAKKDGVDSAIAKYDGLWSVEVPESSAIQGDYTLVLRSKAKHHAVAAKMPKPFIFQPGKQFVVQYDVKFQNGMECGGAYIKLLTDTPGLDLTNFHDKTPYTVMFGPDKCGLDYKLHFIFRHKHPKTGAIEEKHAKKPKADLESYFTDKKTHLYTLVVNPDNTFQVYVDQKLVNSGNLLEDMEPPVNPAKEIDDPSDKKPSDWDERPKIPDSKAKKPDDWDENAPEFVPDESAKKPDGWLDDEPTMISDPTATKPKDWDTEMDGEWEPAKIENPKCKDAPGCGEWKRPKVKNPAYKGKWSPPMIDNPAYKGLWKPKRISNPNYFEDTEPYMMQPIGALGLELWSMTEGIAFDNFVIADNKKAADDYAAATWEVKKDEERRADPNAQSVVDAIREATNEKPWLWAVIILVVALPVVLIIAYCCMRGGGSSDEAAFRKKTDAPTPDDEPIPEETAEDEGEGDHESGGEENVQAAGDQSSPGKGSLEEDEDEEEEDEEGESPAEEPEPEPAKVEESHSEEEKTRAEQ